jgi:hypothetical protein
MCSWSRNRDKNDNSWSGWFSIDLIILHLYKTSPTVFLGHHGIPRAVIARVRLGDLPFRLFSETNQEIKGSKCTKWDGYQSRRLAQQATSRVWFILLLHLIIFDTLVTMFLVLAFLIYLYHFILFFHELLSTLVLGVLLVVYHSLVVFCCVE